MSVPTDLERATDRPIAVVTGASSGIGKAIAIKLLDNGFQVVGIARFQKEKPLDHPYFFPYLMDLSCLRSIPSKLKTLIAAYPRIDSLICCAGKGIFKDLEQFSYEEIKILIELNFLSTVFIVKAFLPSLKKRGSGNIVLIGSEAGLSGQKRGSIYCASKFAMRGFAQALRQECSPSGVRVILLNPGMVDTSFFSDLDFRPGDGEEEHLKVDDIAEALFLAIKARKGAVFYEISLAPQKKYISRKDS